MKESKSIEGKSIPEDSYIAPNDGPGFGLEIEEEWIVPFWD